MDNNLLHVETDVPLGAVIEYFGLCFDSWIDGNAVVCENERYTFSENGGKLSVEIKFKKSVKLSCDGAISAAQKLMSLGAQVDAEGAWCKVPAVKEALCSTAKKTKQAPNMDLPIHSYCRLTLSDLNQIHDLLSVQKTPADRIRYDDGPRSIFPYLDLFAGDYGSMRHRSGNEIHMNWIGNQTPGRHKIDAPIPSGTDLLKSKTKNTSNDTNGDSKPLGPYRKSDTNRWRIAYMLGGIPDADKPRVFDWVTNCFHDIDYFHDTRGGIALPDVFEIEFSTGKLTATHDFVFQLERS